MNRSRGYSASVSVVMVAAVTIDFFHLTQEPVQDVRIGVVVLLFGADKVTVAVGVVHVYVVVICFSVRIVGSDCRGGVGCGGCGEGGGCGVDCGRGGSSG